MIASIAPVILCGDVVDDQHSVDQDQQARTAAVIDTSKTLLQSVGIRHFPSASGRSPTSILSSSSTGVVNTRATSFLDEDLMLRAFSRFGRLVGRPCFSVPHTQAVAQLRLAKQYTSQMAVGRTSQEETFRFLSDTVRLEIANDLWLCNESPQRGGTQAGFREFYPDICHLGHLQGSHQFDVGATVSGNVSVEAPFGQARFDVRFRDVLAETVDGYTSAIDSPSHLDLASDFYCPANEIDWGLDFDEGCFGSSNLLARIDMKDIANALVSPGNRLYLALKRPPFFFLEETNREGDVRLSRASLREHQQASLGRFLTWGFDLGGVGHNNRDSCRLAACLERNGVRVWHTHIVENIDNNIKSLDSASTMADDDLSFEVAWILRTLAGEQPSMTHFLDPGNRSFIPATLLTVLRRMTAMMKFGQRLSKREYWWRYFAVESFMRERLQHWFPPATAPFPIARATSVAVVNGVSVTGSGDSEIATGANSVRMPASLEDFERSSRLFFDRSLPDNDTSFVVSATPTRFVCKRPESMRSNRVIRNFGDAGFFLRVRFCDEDEANITEVGLVEANLRKICGDSRETNGIFSDDLQDNFSMKQSAEEENRSLGIRIGDRTFQRLHWSNSQMRTGAMWLFSPHPESKVTPRLIREWVGDLSPLASKPPKYASRLALAFSSSLPMFDVTWTVIDDIERNDFCFTDGVGEMSTSVARRVQKKLGLERPPSAIQIRLGGAKGVLVVNPDLGRGLGSSYRGQDLVLRKSQVKFASDSRLLELLAYAKRNDAHLNQQIIQLLSARGVPDRAILKKMDQALQRAAEIVSDPIVALAHLREMGVVPPSVRKQGGFVLKEPFFRALLQYRYALEVSKLKRKTSILIPQGANLLGVSDDHKCLREREVFLRLSRFKIDADSGEKLFAGYETITGPLFVVRNPCLHPGDVLGAVLGDGSCRLVAVDRPELNHLCDCVVFPTVGDRPLPDQTSGGDLDGDTFTCVWDPDLIPPLDCEPMDYSDDTLLVPSTEESEHRPDDLDSPDLAAKFLQTLEEMIEHLRVVLEGRSGSQLSRAEQEELREKTEKDLREKQLLASTQAYFKNCITSTDLGRICNAHKVLADRESAMADGCKTLAKLASDAVDAPKTGARVEIPRNLLPREYPEWMEKWGQPSYYERTILQRCYELCPHLDLEKFFGLDERGNVELDIETGVSVGHQGVGRAVGDPATRDDARSSAGSGKKNQSSVCHVKRNFVNRWLHVPGHELYVYRAERYFAEYRCRLRALMRQHGVQHEAELFVGMIDFHRGYSRKDRLIQSETVKREMGVICKHYRDLFMNEEKGDSPDWMQQKAYAWYITAYECEQRRLLRHQKNVKSLFLSFGWIMSDILFGIYAKKSRSLEGLREGVLTIGVAPGSTITAETAGAGDGGMDHGEDADEHHEEEIANEDLYSDITASIHAQWEDSRRDIERSFGQPGHSSSSFTTDFLLPVLSKTGNCQLIGLISVITSWSVVLKFPDTDRKVLILLFFVVAAGVLDDDQKNHHVHDDDDSRMKRSLPNIPAGSKVVERTVALGFADLLDEYVSQTIGVSTSSIEGRILIKFLQRLASLRDDYSCQESEMDCSQFLETHGLHGANIGSTFGEDSSDGDRESASSSTNPTLRFSDPAKIHVSAVRALHEVLLCQQAHCLCSSADVLVDPSQRRKQFVIARVPVSEQEWIARQLYAAMSGSDNGGRGDSSGNVMVRAFPSREHQTVRLVADATGSEVAILSVAKVVGKLRDCVRRFHDQVGGPGRSTLEDHFSRRSGIKIADEAEMLVGQKRAEILALVRDNPVVVISGATGCGKSTGVPQILLESNGMDLGAENGIAPKRILCAQPRRVAAHSLAAYVAKQSNCRLGEEVGYSIGGAHEGSRRTQLYYCTTAIAMMHFLQSSVAYTHLIVDEVHDRSVYVDILLALVKLHHLRHNVNLRVILMSAAQNSAERLAAYFISPETGRPAPVLRLDGSTPYEITTKHLEDLPDVYGGSSTAMAGLSEYTAKIWAGSIPTPVFPAVDLARAVLALHRQYALSAKFLIFLPGTAQINAVKDELDYLTPYEDNIDGEDLWMVCALHSRVPVEQQQKILATQNPSRRTIILATDVVETSVTIPDCEVVLDSCQHRRMRPGGTAGGEMQLVSELICEDEALQRRGRTGRTCRGTVYRLIPRGMQLEKCPTPEMQRSGNLADTLLALQAGLGGLCVAPAGADSDDAADVAIRDPRKFLSLCPAPPDAASVDDAYARLVEVGALVESGGRFGLFSVIIRPLYRIAVDHDMYLRTSTHHQYWWIPSIAIGSAV